MLESLDAYYSNWEKKKQIITVFLLTYKRPNYLPIMMDSILNQTYQNYYLIVLDNMSGDRTSDVVSSFNDERVIYIEHDGQKTGSNYRYAFEIAQTKYLVILHDDDVLEKQYLDTMVSCLENNPELVSVSCTGSIIDTSGVLIQKGGFFDGIKVFKDTEYLMDYYIERKWRYGIVFPAVVYRKAFFSCIGSFLDLRTGPAGDQFLWFETERRGGYMGVVGQPLYNYRRHDSQNSFANISTMDFKLLGFLFSIGYYSLLLSEKKKYVSSFILRALKDSMLYYKQGYLSKKDLYQIYKTIPLEMKKSVLGAFYCSFFRFATIFPGFLTTAINIKHKVTG